MRGSLSKQACSSAHRLCSSSSGSGACGKIPASPHHGFAALPIATVWTPLLSGCALHDYGGCGLRRAHLPTVWLPTRG